MSFYARDFIYDSVISSEYGLRISSDGDSSSLAGATVQLETQEIYRKVKPYLLGVKQSPVLTIPIYITVPIELSAMESSVISKWLFGRTNYKKLQIVQPDMEYVYYNCIFTEPTIEKIGNIIRGYHASIVCDSPFAWEFPKTVTYSYPNGYYVYETINIYNMSDNDDYTYPNITFTMNDFGGAISIINESDSNRESEFTGLSSLEEITINNDIQTISSSTGLNRLPSFNYKWMRYVPKINKLKIEGNVSSISFTHQFAKKVV